MQQSFSTLFSSLQSCYSVEIFRDLFCLKCFALCVQGCRSSTLVVSLGAWVLMDIFIFAVLHFLLKFVIGSLLVSPVE